MHQEVHYNEVEQVHQNPVFPKQRTYHPVDTDNVMELESGQSGDDNTCDAMSSRCLSGHHLSIRLLKFPSAFRFRNLCMTKNVEHCVN